MLGQATIEEKYKDTMKDIKKKEAFGAGNFR
jgi:hypothetical protein